MKILGLQNFYSYSLFSYFIRAKNTHHTQTHKKSPGEVVGFFFLFVCYCSYLQTLIWARFHRQQSVRPSTIHEGDVLRGQNCPTLFSIEKVVYLIHTKTMLALVAIQGTAIWLLPHCSFSKSENSS